MEKSRIEKYEVLFFLLIAVILLSWGNQTTVLWNQDEAAYAGFAKQMVQSGNWLIPEFHWSDVHRKTPFHFWMIAISYLLFGVNEFAVRFSSVLFTFGTLILMYLGGKKIWSHQIALTSCIVLLSSLLVPALAKIAVTDATLLFFESLCAFSLILFFQSKQIKWIVWFWIGFSLALITKGPPVIIFTGLFGILLLLFHPEGKIIWKLKPWFFFPLAIIPLLIWGYFAWQTDGGQFISWLIDWYILSRVGGNVFGQTGPPGFYLVIFLISFWIWTPFLFTAFWESIKSVIKKKGLLWPIWLISGWILYEFVSSKLPAYTIASHPAIAIGIALALHQISNRQKQTYRIAYILLLVFTFSGVILLYLNADRFQMMPIRNPLIIYLMVLGIAIFILLLISSGRMKPEFRKLVLVSTLIPNFVLWCWMIPSFQPALRGHLEMAEYVQSEMNSKRFTVTIGNWKGKPPSLPFYIEQIGANIEFETDTIKLQEKYNTKDTQAFVLNQSQIDFLQQFSPDIKIREFRTFSLDHQKMESYFVVLKK